MIVLALVLAGAAVLLAWLLFEHPRIQYGELKSPRMLASALSSIAPGHHERAGTSTERRSVGRRSSDGSAEPRGEPQDEDVETMVRRHLYGSRSD